MATFEKLKLSLGYPLRQSLHIGRRSDTIVASGRKQHWLAYTFQPVPGVMTRPRLELQLCTWLVARLRLPFTRYLQEVSPALGVSGSPPGIAAQVGHSQMPGQSLLLRQPGQFMKRERRTAGTSSAGTGKRQRPHLFREAQYQLLGHHAAKRNAHDQRLPPAQGVEQGRGIFRVVGHRIGTIGFRGLAQSPLIVGHHFEMPNQRAVQHVGPNAQIAAGSADEKQPRSLPGLLKVDIDIPHRNHWHEQAPAE